MSESIGGGRRTDGVGYIHISPVREGTLLRELHGMFGVRHDPGLQQQFRPRIASAIMVFTAMLTVFTVATARCKLNAYNDATHEGSELRGQIRA